jgi:hypothetical protein
MKHRWSGHYCMLFIAFEFCGRVSLPYAQQKFLSRNFTTVTLHGLSAQ